MFSQKISFLLVGVLSQWFEYPAWRFSWVCRNWTVHSPVICLSRAISFVLSDQPSPLLQFLIYLVHFGGGTAKQRTLLSALGVVLGW